MNVIKYKDQQRSYFAVNSAQVVTLISRQELAKHPVDCEVLAVMQQEVLMMKVLMVVEVMIQIYALIENIMMTIYCDQHKRYLKQENNHAPVAAQDLCDITLVIATPCIDKSVMALGAKTTH